MDEHANADCPKTDIFEPGSNVTFARRLQFLKQDLEIVSIDEGMQIDVSDEQFSKADSPRFERREPIAKVKCDRFRQSLKQNREIVSIDEGTQIDSSEEQNENADSPSVGIRHADVNSTSQIESQ
jgi:hypothetical protein